MGVVDEAIHDCIGNGWVSDIFVPVFNRQLAGNEGGGMSVSVFNDLQKIPPFRVGHWSQSQVVDHKEMGFVKLSHDLCITSIGFGHGEVVVELRGAGIEGPVALAASFMSQGLW